MRQSDRPNTIGLPFHGLSTDGVMPLPNSTTIAAPNTTGFSKVVRHPSPPTVTRTTTESAADTQDGKVWRDYLLVSGNDLYVGGESLAAAYGQGAFIYIDGAGTPWVITASAGGPPGGPITVRVTLAALFGRINRPHAVIARDLIYTTLADPIPTSGTDQLASGQQQNLGVFGSDYPSTNETGSQCKLNIRVGARSAFSKWASVEDAYSDEYGPWDRSILSDILTITIAGNGSTDQSTLGDGISASFTRESYPHAYSSSTTPVSCSQATFVDNLPTSLCFTTQSADLGGHRVNTLTEILGEWFIGNTVHRGRVEISEVEDWCYASTASGCVGPGCDLSGLSGAHNWQQTYQIDRTAYLPGGYSLGSTITGANAANVAGPIFGSCEIPVYLEVSIDQNKADAFYDDYAASFSGSSLRCVIHPGGVASYRTDGTSGLIAVDGLSAQLPGTIDYTGASDVRVATNREDGLITVSDTSNVCYF